MIRVEKMNALIKNEGNTWMYFHVCKCWFNISDSLMIALGLCVCVCACVSFIIYPIYHNYVSTTYKLYVTEKCYGTIFTFLSISLLSLLIFYKGEIGKRGWALIEQEKGEIQKERKKGSKITPGTFEKIHKKSSHFYLHIYVDCVCV